MKFLIQHNSLRDAQVQRIDEAMKQYSLPHEYIGVIPFSHEITSETPIEGIDYIPIGSCLLTSIAEQRGWVGLHYNAQTFNYSAAVENRNDMLNGDGTICNIEQAIELLETLPRDVDVFIRPSHDLKQFSGRVDQAGECADFLKDAMLCESSGSYKLDQSTTIVVSQPVTIEEEWRWFVVGGVVVDGAMYRKNGTLCEVHVNDTILKQQMQTLANVWLPDSCCVMDTALAGGRWYVIEFNTINSSGLYGHDAGVIYNALYQYHTQ